MQWEPDARPDGDGDDRPTLVPNFDPGAFARDSEIRQRSEAIADEDLTVERAQRLHLEGDHEQALSVLTRLLDLAPLHPEATKLSRQCRAALARECLSAIGSETAVPVLGVSAEELARFSLDNVSTFLLSRIDGFACVRDVLDVAGLPPLLALRHLRNLVERGLVCVPSSPRRLPATDHTGLRDDRDATSECNSSTVEIAALPSRREVPTLSAIPVVLVSREDVARFPIDPQARALIALVNDERSVEEILVATKTDLVVGLGLFEHLAHSGLVAFV
jgi:hypothetical protein